jgi:hypothetical protein
LEDYSLWTIDDEENEMTTLIVIAAIVFVLYCFTAEWNCSAKHSPVTVTILCRLVARHLKLVSKLLVGLIYFFGGISTVLLMQKDPRVVDAPQGHLANFLDRVTKPIAAMGALLGSIALIKHILLHPLPYGIAAIVTYLLWLLVTICDLVEDEVVSSWTYTVSEEHGGDVAHRVLTGQDYVVWSAGTFVIWITVLVTTGAWVCSRIPT